MKLDDVLKKVAASTGVARADVKKAVEAAFAEIKTAVEAGEKVSVPGWGAFLLKERVAGEKTDKQGNVRKVEAARSLWFRPAAARPVAASNRKKKKNKNKAKTKTEAAT